jgi:hypothetical protein
MVLDLSNENENAFDLIRVNREFDSNEIDESKLHSRNTMIQEFQYPMKL